MKSFCTLFNIYFVVFLIESSMGSCGNDIDELIITDDKEFIIVKEKVEWWQAVAKCTENGYDLVSIECKEKNEALLKKLNKEMLNGNNNTDFWTAGTNLHNVDSKSKKNHAWFTTGELFDYANWNEGQPNNYKEKQHCVYVVHDKNLKWEDADCVVKMYFICQKRCC